MPIFSTKRGYHVTLAAMLLAVLVLAFASLWPDREISRMSYLSLSPLVSTRGFMGGYEWVSTNELFTVVYRSGQLIPVKVDLSSGARVPFASIESELERRGISSFQWTLSYSGNYVAIYSEAPKFYGVFALGDGELTEILEPLGGHRRFFLPLNPDAIAELFSQGTETLLKVHSLRSKTSYTLAAPADLGTYVGHISRNALFMADLGKEYVSECRFREVSISSEVRIVREFSVRLPRRSRVRDVRLCPSGDRMVYELDVPRKVPTVRVSPVAPFFSMSRSSESRLYITTLDRREEWLVVAPRGGAWWARWLPTENGISFASEGVLHISSTDP
jgi:hypothetical protein